MKKEQRDFLVFGYGLGLIAAIFGVGGVMKHGVHLAPAVLLTCAVIFVSVTALNWQALRPGYAGWMKVAHVIGSVITTLILSVVFFALFAPIGILFRILRKDHLDRSIERGIGSYWHACPAGIKDKARYLQQF